MKGLAWVCLFATYFIPLSTEGVGVVVNTNNKVPVLLLPMLMHTVKISKITTVMVVLLASTMIGVVSAEETGRDRGLEKSAIDDVDDLGGIFTKEECEAAGGVWIVKKGFDHGWCHIKLDSKTDTL